jgi:uncharacterized protein YyaL (SSP411 family)
MALVLSRMQLRSALSHIPRVLCVLFAPVFFVDCSESMSQLQEAPQEKVMPNKLKDEKSPYLQSAAHQPVHWLPWGEEAFQRAKSEGKPILLDIGAVWCHWCHVMDGESYENPEVAKIINDQFIPVKVDRDEQPDIDTRYQTAVSALSGQGGWPLTALLTPDGKVFYGGTYFPPEDRYGRPGLKRILQTLGEKYKSDRNAVVRSAEELSSHLQKAEDRSNDSLELSESLVDSALSSISNSFDIRNGGFGGAPKFPHASAIEFLLWKHFLTNNKWMSTVIDSTLKMMARGGVYDQLAGGFHRYSTDEKWIVPHFEKMLYDNAELLKNYIHAYQATGDEFFKETALGIISFVNTVLSDQERGGFYASQDADVGMNDDGDYFTWTVEEANAALSPEESKVISMYYHLSGAGEMHASGRHVLYVAWDVGEVADSLKKAIPDVKRLIQSGKEKLLRVRLQRKSPFVDTTIYANWNGMMISAHLDAFKAFGEKSYLDFALKVLDRIVREGVSTEFAVAHSIGSGPPRGLLDDQVQVAAALLDAYEVTGTERYLSLARKIMDRTLATNWDREAGGFFDLPQGDGKLGPLGLLLKPIQDSPTSAANSTAILVLVRLNRVTGDESYLTFAERALKHFAPVCKDYGIFAAAYFHALDVFLNPPAHVVIIGRKDDPHTLALHETALYTYRPDKIVQLYNSEAPSEGKLPSVVLSMATSSKVPSAFVCAYFVCAPPARDEATLETTIKSFGIGTGSPQQTR